MFLDQTWRKTGTGLFFRKFGKFFWISSFSFPSSSDREKWTEQINGGILVRALAVERSRDTAF